jgi:hypothetical protein
MTAASSTQRRDGATLFVSWSGSTGRSLASGLSALVSGVFGNRIEVLQRSPGGGEQAEREAEQAKQKADAVLLVLTPGELGSLRLLLDWATFSTIRGRAFAVGYRVTSHDLRRTQFSGLAFAPAEGAAVAHLLRELGNTLGRLPADFDARFDAAWPDFRYVLLVLDDAERRTAHRLDLAAIVAAVLLLVVGGPIVWATRPQPPPKIPCQSGTDADRAECRWRQFVSSRSSGSSPRQQRLDRRLGHRPFALLDERTGCGKGNNAIGRYHVVAPGATQGPWHVPVIFAAAPGQEAASTSSSAVVVAGGSTTVVPEGQCVSVPGVGVRVAAVGVFSPDGVCATLATLRHGAPGNPHLVDDVAGFLSGFGLGEPGALRPHVESWVAGCGTP